MNRKYNHLVYTPEAARMMYDMQQEGYSLYYISVAFSQWDGQKIRYVHRKTISSCIQNHLAKMKSQYELDCETVGDIRPERRTEIAMR